MKVNKQGWKTVPSLSLTLILSTLILSAGCNHDFQGGRGNLDPLPDGISFEIAFLLCPEKTMDENGNLRKCTNPVGENCYSEDFLCIRCLINFSLPWITGEGNPATPMSWNRDINMQFVDTRNLDLFRTGWINRVRHHLRGGGQPGEVQLTYRKRIPIEPRGTSLTEEMIQRTIMQAKREGTWQWAYRGGISDSIEVDWSYDSAVLTLSRNVNGIHFGAAGTPPYFSLAGSQALLLDNLYRVSEGMDSFARWDFKEWYIEQIKDGFLHGPSFIRRYRTRGTILADDSARIFGVEKPQRVTLDVEVMAFRDTYIVELSSSDAISWNPSPSDWLNFAQVARLRQFMYDLLYDAGILLPRSGLRTTTVLNYMRQPGGGRPVPDYHD